MAENDFSKLAKIVRRGYGRVVYVKSFNHYFSVSNVEDVLMV